PPLHRRTLVETGTLLCGVHACRSIDPCLAGDAETTYEVMTSPIHHQKPFHCEGRARDLGVLGRGHPGQVRRQFLHFDLWGGCRSVEGTGVCVQGDLSTTATCQPRRKVRDDAA
ncbi:uncharacterized protein BO95DRAFT_491634, partial [Aspergillus brunneoviolaceus CBS 621.78]